MRSVARRIVELLLVVLIVTFGTTMLVDLLPGDPAVEILGPEREPEDYAELNRELGLDLPVFERYGRWAGDAVRGDLGKAILPPGGKVSSRISAAIPISLQLAVLGIGLALTVSVGLSLVAAARPGSRIDRLVAGLNFGLVSMPSFLVGLLLTMIFVKQLNLLPRAGWVRPTDGGIIANLRTAILPALVVAFPSIPVFTQVLRADLGRTLEQDFILAARARGLPYRRVLVLDALRPSMFSLVTLIGLAVGQAIGATIIAENLFGIQGLGSVIVKAANDKDLPLLQGSVAVIAVFYVLLNTVVDLSYSWLDPRVRRQGPAT